MTTTSRIRVAAAQMIFSPTIAGNLDSIARAVAEAGRRRADAIVFPECAVTGYQYPFATLTPRELRTALRAVSGIAAAHGINVLLGTPVLAGRRRFNCLVVFDRAGKAVHCYAKNQLTPRDRAMFTPGNAVALFDLDGVCCTAIICHERRYPELVRIPAMAGAQIIFHPNAGLDTLSVSRKKRNGSDGIAVRAFENAVYYVFANSTGPQGGGKWSAGDSKIVAPDGKVLALADNESECVIVANLDLAMATGKYARDSIEHPRFLSSAWRRIVRDAKKQADTTSRSLLSHLGL